MFTFIQKQTPLSETSLPRPSGEGGMLAKARENPVHRLPDWRTTLPLAQSCPRCGAKTRSGRSCRSPAMRNSRCRMHGGSSTGPTAAGIERIRSTVTFCCPPVPRLRSSADRSSTNVRDAFAAVVRNQAPTPQPKRPRTNLILWFWRFMLRNEAGGRRFVGRRGKRPLKLIVRNFHQLLPAG